MCWTKCGNNGKNKLKGVSKSQSKHNKFEECYNCLFGGEYHKIVIIILFDQIIMKCIFDE